MNLLRVTIEGEAEQVDFMRNQLRMDPSYRLCDHSELIKPNSNEKNLVCYLYPKQVNRSISFVQLSTTNGEIRPIG
jgi:hypothetical protein